MKMNEITSMSVEELNKKRADLKQELFNLRFQASVNQLENVMRIKEVRKDIARINTALEQKRLASFKENSIPCNTYSQAKAKKKGLTIAKSA